jgi:aryl-alcohol dehydrogenase-like predicted oxidoreductase
LNRVYGAGVLEETVGHWVQNKPLCDLVITTKARFPMGLILWVCRARLCAKRVTLV